MLSTINVRVARPDGKVTLKERRVLRFVKPGGSLAGTMCIARHKKAIIVTHIIDHETVAVDMKAARIPLSDTRTATLLDLSGGTIRPASAA